MKPAPPSITSPSKSRERETIARLRSAAGLTREELSAALGSDPSAVLQWEMGERTLLVADAWKICKYFGISLDSLATGLPDGWEESLPESWAQRFR